MSNRRSSDTADADVIVVGGGHNGLIGAAYLARAGFDTLLLEARSSAGGCASTVTDLDARFNICNCDHTMIRVMPILDELDLEALGLRYAEPEASVIAQFYDSSSPWVGFHEIDRTLESIAAFYPTQVDGYRRYLADAMPVAQLAIDIAKTTPTVPHFVSEVLSRNPMTAARLLSWSKKSLTEVLRGYFSAEQMVLPAIAAGPSVWGVRPDLAGTGLAAVGYATRHIIKSGRPVGGSGALTDAVEQSFRQAGGQVRFESVVEKLLLSGGKTAGVRLVDGTELFAPVVIAACDPQRVFTDWIDDVPAGATQLVDEWRSRPVADGYESKIDAVLTKLPTYAAQAKIHEHFPGLDTVGVTSFVSPSYDEVIQAHELKAIGQVAERPTLLVNIPSAIDPAMQGTDDFHVLSLEVLFTPYGLPGGWPGSTEPRRWLDLWEGLLTEPDFDQHVDRWRVMTPDRYEAEFSMHRGHTPAYQASPMATFMAKHPEVSRHETAIDGLFLSGAGTYPGAGVFGAPGRNAAAAVRRSVGR